MLCYAVCSKYDAIRAVLPIPMNRPAGSLTQPDNKNDIIFKSLYRRCDQHFFHIFFVAGHFLIPEFSVSAHRTECLRRRKQKFLLQESRFIGVSRVGPRGPSPPKISSMSCHFVL